MRVIGTPLLLALTGCGGSDVHCDLCGKWKSNEMLTLSEMEVTTELDEDREAFFRDNYFGRLIVEFSSTHVRSYFEEEGETAGTWEPYVILERQRDMFKLEVPSEVSGQTKEWTFVLAGDCYRTHIERVGFSEHFCRARTE
jgi:hypothetical protein